ncbi:hypothetical protein [Halobacterium zhouii]|uniref:hypothetical protein n=1 Tax=Halobacterium zhouii TaxID=2902624 RepID=UPI001E2B2247|nr:hypothetical protein [Halobacterium zhouii]
MSLQSTRRRVLRTGGVLTATALAGCTALSGNGSKDPDAGTDSYGVRLENETEQTQSVTISATLHSGGEPVFEETVESAPDEPQKWDQVLTGEQTFVVEATVDHEHFIEGMGSNVRMIVVGASNSIEARNVVVTVAPYDPGIVAKVGLGTDG